MSEQNTTTPEAKPAPKTLVATIRTRSQELQAIAAGDAQRIAEEAAKAAEADPVSVVTVRMPASLHSRLKEAAIASRLSMNQFCVATLDIIVDQIERELAPKPAPPA